MTEVGRALRAARTAAGLSLQAMAARTNYSKPYLGQLETGVRMVRAEHVAAYESVLHTSLWDLHDRLAVESVGVARDLPAQLAPLLSLLPDADLPAQFRQLLRQPPPTRSRDGFAPEEVDAAEELARWARARQWDDESPARAPVTAWLAMNIPRLRRLSPGTSNAPALLIGAELADIAATMSWDVEDNRAARRYFVTAARLAHAAGDPALTGAVLAETTWQCLDNGCPAEGLEIVQLAQYIARRTATPHLRSILAELEACAHGILGDRAACLRASIVAAECRAEANEVVREPVPGDTSLAAVAFSMVLGPRRDWPGPGRQSQLLGPTYRDLAVTRPDLVRTASAHIRAPRLDSFIPAAMALIFSARLQLMLREPEQAAAQIEQALATHGAEMPARTTARLRDFHYEAAEFAAVPAVRGVRTTIAELATHR
ncbi:helix-turn-helix domain-containing protein [Nocardia sp. NPDC003183]